MEAYLGYLLYFLSLATVGGIYAIFALGLNVQWGFAGLFNVGIVGFAAVGAYTYALLTTAESTFHYGGLDLPLPVGMFVAMVASAVIAGVIGLICIRLRSDYLAIATIGIAEIIKLILKNETEVTNGPRGINKIPRAWEHFSEERFYSSWPMSWFNTPDGWAVFFDALPHWWWQPCFAATVLFCMYVIYRMLERARISPWGRMMTAIRENEPAARAAGKNVTARRVEAFVIGAAIMGFAGALFAQHLRLIEPTNTFDPAKVTFLVWVMLILGGSGNNRGAMLGAFLIWTIWSASELMISGIIDLAGYVFQTFDTGLLATRAGFLRMMLIGILMQVVLQKYPAGILPEVRPASPRSNK
ncbi:branched-chain amino acid ABC transporter permease [Planktomarina temperata]|jgi:branched-chain amino acid transport system permease protein|uniref:branched-chain amino acid ABC transporter permease n=1 Tax=Planktomarina temperata TaxID=1284658 RepID=UPI001DB8AB72|nr:branched-chain amino acid ABC transporter permease [Marinovum sp.]MBT6545936.1 branched-chain amino acid ABC transporter permease [Paracoccaceae bacterium]MDA7458180.1 branched-chain amino acid ABC transporter permease [Planktomarina temperata]MDA9009781.1 branched-chain amino acid ABC transporter permease [bacterium]MDB2399600.1 branched-chain amino acid ABC transporter permease [Planktomarina sp.]